MATGCHRQLTFWEIGRQEVIASFDGGRIVSDAGLLSLRQFEKELGILSNLASRFPDPRAQRYVTHTSEALLTQRRAAAATSKQSSAHRQQRKLSSSRRGGLLRRLAATCGQTVQEWFGALKNIPSATLSCGTNRRQA